MRIKASEEAYRNGKKSGQCRLAGESAALPGFSDGTFPNPMRRSQRSVSPRDLSEPTKTIQRFGTANRMMPLRAIVTGIPLSRKVGRLSSGIRHHPEKASRIGHDPGSCSNIPRTPAVDPRLPCHRHQIIVTTFRRNHGVPAPCAARSLHSSEPTSATGRLLCRVFFSLPLNKAPLLTEGE